MDSGLDICYTDGGSAISKHEANLVPSVFKDYLIANATSDEYVSFRNPTKGTTEIKFFHENLLLKF